MFLFDCQIALLVVSYTRKQKSHFSLLISAFGQTKRLEAVTSNPIQQHEATSVVTGSLRWLPEVVWASSLCSLVVVGFRLYLF